MIVSRVRALSKLWADFWNVEPATVEARAVSTNHFVAPSSGIDDKFQLIVAVLFVRRVAVTVVGP
jgi:hypothetical protein